MKRIGRLYRENLVQKIGEGVESSGSVFLISYSQVSSLAISDLRKSLKQAKASMHASKNAIARLALKKKGHAKLAERINGQTALVWSDVDSVEVSKILINFAKSCEGISVKGGVLDGRDLQEADVKKLSELPSREVLLATLLGTIQAPLTRFMGALNAKSGDLLSILKQLSEKKGGN